jgi:hypothetical protein
MEFNCKHRQLFSTDQRPKNRQGHFPKADHLKLDSMVDFQSDDVFNQEDVDTIVKNAITSCLTDVM